MKKIFIYLFSLVVLWNTGCEGVLEVEPENSVTYTNYFKTVQDAEAILAGCERKIKMVKMPMGSMYYVATAHCGAGLLVDVYDYEIDAYRSMDPSRYEGTVSSCYAIIEQAHMLLDNAHRFEISEEELRPYLQQAHFARAIGYFELAREWGEVPIVTDYVNYPPVPQSPVSKVFDEVEKSALIAFELPIYEELTDGYGKPRTSKQYGSKGAAAALLAQLYAWRAAVENKPEYWEEAEKYCTMIIDGKVGHYALATDPHEVCNVVMKGESSEGIREILNTIASGEFDPNYGFGQDAYYEQTFFSTYPVRTESYMGPDPDNYYTQFYKERVNRMYDKEDMRRDAYFYAVDADSLYVIYNQSSGELVQKYVVKEDGRSRYYRLNRSTWKVEEENRLLGAGETISAAYDNRRIDMAFLQKYRFPYYAKEDNSLEPSYLGMEMNRVVWRLADIYLLRAECRAYRNDPKAADDLNEIRRRAYGNDSHKYTTAGGDIKLAIFREREKEFLFEDNRWYDVVRNGFNHLNGHTDYDYIRNELSEAYAALTDQDIRDGALYLSFSSYIFVNNELIRQNVYWNQKVQ